MCCLKSMTCFVLGRVSQIKVLIQLTKVPASNPFPSSSVLRWKGVFDPAESLLPLSKFQTLITPERLWTININTWIRPQF